MRSKHLLSHRKAIDNRSIMKKKSLAQKTKRRNNRIKKNRRTRNTRGGGKPQRTTSRSRNHVTPKRNLDPIGKTRLPPLVRQHQRLLKSLKYLLSQMNTLTQNVRKTSEALGADGINILIPYDIKPIGYAFSVNCDEYYYMILGYYFVKNENNEFELDGYLAMQPRLIVTGAIGTEIPIEGVHMYEECNFTKPITRTQYENEKIALSVRIMALRSIIEDRELFHSVDESYFRIGYLPKQS